MRQREEERINHRIAADIEEKDKAAKKMKKNEEEAEGAEEEEEGGPRHEDRKEEEGQDMEQDEDNGEDTKGPNTDADAEMEAPAEEETRRLEDEKNLTEDVYKMVLSTIENLEVQETLTEMLKSIDVAEIYSPPRVTREAKKWGLEAGDAMDLTTGWDFNIGTTPKSCH